jgi:hypothetical protein
MTETVISVHLTDEEQDDILIGCASAERARHAVECELCGTRIGVFRSSMSAFNEGTMAWAQAKSNTVSRDLSAARISDVSGRPVRWSMGLATTATLVFGLAIGIHRGTDTAKMPAETTVATASAEEEIASDNEMLQAIHTEISGTAAPAPLRQYRPASTRISTSSRRNEVQN